MELPDQNLIYIVWMFIHFFVWGLSTNELRPRWEVLSYCLFMICCHYNYDHQGSIQSIQNWYSSMSHCINAHFLKRQCTAYLALCLLSIDWIELARWCLSPQYWHLDCWAYTIWLMLGSLRYFYQTCLLVEGTETGFRIQAQCLGHRLDSRDICRVL